MLGVETRVTTSKNTSGAISDGVERALLDAAGEGFRVSQERVPADTGQLQQSGVQPTVLSDGSVVWGYNAEYARFVEEGTSSHFPPVEALRGWARRVLGDEGAAWGVAKKIAAEGTPAQPFVEPGVDAMTAKLRSTGIGAYISDNL